VEIGSIRSVSKAKLFRRSRSRSGLAKTGIAVLFRYGVAVLIGLSPEDEIGFLERLKPRIGGKLARLEEETAILALASEAEDQVQSGGPIELRDMLPERLLSLPTCWRRASCLPMTNAKLQKCSRSSSHLRRSWQIMGEPEGTEKRFCS